MQPAAFTPWSWRDQSLLAGGSSRTGDPAAGINGSDTAYADERATTDVTGYDVEATDGGIGSVDDATYDVGSAYLVVDTGKWIFGRKVLLPAGTVLRVDHADRTVYVDRSKEQIKNSPEYDEDTFGTPDYRDRVGTYYADSYRDVPRM